MDLSTSRFWAGLALVVTFTACGDATDLPPDARDADGVAAGPSDGTLLGEESAEGQAVLALVNRELASPQEVETFRQLLETEVHETTVTRIVDFRLGQDGSIGTGDDQTFPNLRTLDQVEFVGPVAIRGLLRIAEAEGMVGSTPVCDLSGVLETEQIPLIADNEFTWNIERTMPLEALHEQSCSTIENAVAINIEEGLPPDFQNLEPFTGVRSIAGTLAIDSTTGITSLRGLDGLEELQALRVRQNDGDLDRVDGLSGLQTLRDLRLKGSSSNRPLIIDGLNGLEEVQNAIYLESVDGTDVFPSLRKVGRLSVRFSFGAGSDNVFPSLESVDEFWITASSIDFRDMPNLRDIRVLRVESGVTDFRGLEEFEEFERLLISGGSLESLDGLQNVKAVGALNLNLHRTDENGDYTGLSGLEMVGHNLFVYSANKQRNVEFASLTTIEGNLDIDQTKILQLRDTFPSLRHIGGNIYVNEEVDQAELDAFVDQLDHFTGTIERQR